MARALTAAMLAAIATGATRPLFFYEGEFSGGTVRLFTGHGTLDWDGKSWTGDEGLMRVESMAETSGLEAVSFRVSLNGQVSSLLSVALAQVRRGKLGSVWLGLVGREVVESGTAQAGSANTLTLAAVASSAVNAKILRLPTGPGSVQERTVSAYDGATKVATVNQNWNAQYLSLPGTIGNYASTPDSAALTLTGTIEVIFKGVMTWQDGLQKYMGLGRYAGDASGRPVFAVVAGAGMFAEWIDSGGQYRLVASSAGASHANDTYGVVKIQLIPDNGAGGHTVRFFQSTDDGATYTQVGTDRTHATFPAAHALSDSTSPILIGTYRETVSGEAMHVHYAEIRNGIDGPVVAKFDPLNDGGKIGDTSFPSSTGEVWTINQSGSPAAELLPLPDATTGYEVIDENGIIADPILCFRGRADKPEIVPDPVSAVVGVAYESRLIDAGRRRERRYTPEDQAIDFPGDLGFDQVAALQDTVFTWGRR